MTPTEELMTEHDGIRKMLDILDGLLSKSEKADDSTFEDLDKILNFFKVFVDMCHHGKEENYLFPAFEKSGIPREGGPIGVMLEEHEMGRKLVKEMRDRLEKVKNGQAAGLSEFSETAAKYGDLLVNHIEKENKVLFPMGDKRLSSTERFEISRLFAKWEKEKIGEGRHDLFHEQMAFLAEKYV